MRSLGIRMCMTVTIRLARHDNCALRSHCRNLFHIPVHIIVGITDKLLGQSSSYQIAKKGSKSVAISADSETNGLH